MLDNHHALSLGLNRAYVVCSSVHLARRYSRPARFEVSSFLDKIIACDVTGGGFPGIWGGLPGKLHTGTWWKPLAKVSNVQTCS